MQILWATLIILAVSLATFIVAIPIENFKRPLLGSMGPNSFFLGSVDGKSYMVDSAPRNWTEALEFCTDSGMRLGTVSSTVQLEFLKSKHDDNQFYVDHWTGGRDALTVQQVVWNHDTSPVSASVVEHLLVSTNIQTCLAYDAFSSGHFHLYPCSSKIKVLCEL